jgi:pyruvate formate lyase activating enzyme
VTRALVADVVEASFVDGPGNRYVIFLQGCTFNCVTCHNPHTIACGQTEESRWVDVAELLADIRQKAGFLSGVTVSGGEPTRQAEALHALFQQLADDPATARLTRLVDSNGDAEPHTWELLSTVMDAAMIDLKALDPEVHRALTGRPNDRVLASLRQLSRLDRLAEVRLLIVPGANDDAAQIAATARWLGTLDPAPMVVVQGFRHDGARPFAHRFREAGRDDLRTVAATLVEHGLRAAQVAIRGRPARVEHAEPAVPG